MNYQQDQLQQLQKDKIAFKRQEMEFHRKGESIPPALRKNLENNTNNIDNVKRVVESLRNSYHKTETDYAAIISRLNLLEKNKVK